MSCGSAGYCSAVGDYQEYLGTSPSGIKMAASHGLLVSQSAGKWARAANPSPDVELRSVSCASAGNCSAVGDGFLLSETAGSWTMGVRATLPANATSNSLTLLNSVSCGSVGDCSAVGSYTDSADHTQGLLVTESGGSWAPGVEATLPANVGSDPNVSLSSVSCAAPSDCSAVGTYIDSSGNRQGLLLTESGGSWAPGVEATLPADAGLHTGVSLNSVSCALPDDCSAVGNYFDSADNQQGLLLNESDGRWASGVEASLPANAGPGPFTSFPLGSVSCASAGDCSAVGAYNDSSGNRQGLLLSESAGTWQRGVEATLPTNAGRYPAAELSSVSCAQGGDCSAVGFYQAKSGHTRGLLIGTLTVLSGLRVSPKTFRLAGRRVNGRCAKQTARNRTRPSCTRPVKMSVRYQLNVPARVAITIQRVLPGRFSQRRCVAPTRRNRMHRRCNRVIPLRGSLTKDGRPGSNRLTFHGRIGGRGLPPGTYQLTATPSFGSPRTVKFSLFA